MKTEQEIIKGLQKLEDRTFPDLLESLSDNIISKNWESAYSNILDLGLNIAAYQAAERIII